MSSADSHALPAAAVHRFRLLYPVVITHEFQQRPAVLGSASRICDCGQVGERPRLPQPAPRPPGGRFLQRSHRATGGRKQRLEMPPRVCLTKISRTFAEIFSPATVDGDLLMPAALQNENEAVRFSNLSATPAAFTLSGGYYAITVKATWGGGSVALQRLAVDGATFIAVTPAMTADGLATVSLPPGTYRLAVTTATAVFADIIAIVRSI